MAAAVPFWLITPHLPRLALSTRTGAAGGVHGCVGGRVVLSEVRAGLVAVSRSVLCSGCARGSVTNHMRRAVRDTRMRPSVTRNKCLEPRCRAHTKRAAHNEQPEPLSRNTSQAVRMWAHSCRLRVSLCAVWRRSISAPAVSTVHSYFLVPLSGAVSNALWCFILVIRTNKNADAESPDAR